MRISVKAELAAPEAVSTLILRVDEHVSQFKKVEARELYKLG